MRAMQDHATDTINLTRRDVLRAGAMMALLVSAGLATPAQAAEWNKSAFDAKGVNDVLKTLGGGALDKGGAGIQFNAPDIAENGAVVPLVVTSSLPGTDLIAILVEKNPNTLAATFAIPAGTEPYINTRVKMGQTSTVYAAVRAGGKWVLTSKEVKVTLGGCGG
ncbi:thiosulfate oxidation carrier protein SoxY [Ralstonia syzygii subsp. celebesensis]|uniref:Thiosulfate oxidation carrier protein SoxY n=3 Tax=Ralstonia syzygii TaxID=28097 RepID=A0A1U9VIH6_9RALS|nr:MULTISPECIES: thiosulfate oxidation carrier protein SoxY [Ralstonia solanacearum species complex]CCA80916.1 sulphur oxidation protein [blood disease bacterium R229]AQW30366.1 thiosulfate oxidation carrier protein SoxY [blood disease bacterium A2-HR MARDI]AXV89666.1 thiosulfate oxidation carrier protein SoxY [Ralstonia solanacearum]AXW17872.1 thiosulfate oxidation carrier protein SoxY [Ralstonia solanacearum]AXW60739.1 thiosulfate oxidation carrier protein SoxY [Ralstonia solanacearum]